MKLAQFQSFVGKQMSFALLALAALQGCSDDSNKPAAGSTARAAGPLPQPPSAALVHPRQLPHSQDPRVVACAAALESGDLPQAQSLLLDLADREAPDSICLRARLLAARGDSVGAVREIEAARKTWPDQGCLYATLAEIHAMGGRLESAQEEIRAGLAVAGPTPDLSRARGVLLLLQSGGSKAGMMHLLEATKAEPGLWFCTAALSEAHRLLATEALGEQNPVEALAHARLGLALEPKNPELHLLLADALVATGNFDEGLPAYEEIQRGGRDLGASLRLYYQKGAMMALLEGRKDVALERYVRARQLGATNEELGSGAGVLHRAVVEAQAKADQAYEGEHWNDARTELDKLLAIDPTDMAALTERGVVCFKLEDYASAESSWRTVLERAEHEHLPLPDPVHLKLASALHKQGKDSEIKPLLDQYLAAQPNGEWAQLTREALARLSH